MKTKITVDVELTPFEVPKFVTLKQRIGQRQDGFVEAEQIPLSDLSIAALDELCLAFKREVYANALKTVSVPEIIDDAVNVVYLNEHQDEGFIEYCYATPREAINTISHDCQKYYKRIAVPFVEASHRY